LARGDLALAGEIKEIGQRESNVVPIEKGAAGIGAL